MSGLGLDVFLNGLIYLNVQHTPLINTSSGHFISDGNLTVLP